MEATVGDILNENNHNLARDKLKLNISFIHINNWRRTISKA